MPNAGLLDLVAHGVQDIYLIGNPQISFFKAVYKRHTNFVMESIRGTFDGSQNFGEKITCKIPRSGDLLHTMLLEIDLPELTGSGSDDVNSIRYIPNVGHAIIDYCDIKIGGQSIDKQYGEWMHIWTELTSTNNKKTALNEMIKASGTNGATTLYIPFQFWFCRHLSNALPLVSLQYHEVELDIKLRPLSELYDFGPTYYYNLTASGTSGAKYRYTISTGVPFTTDITGKLLYYNNGSSTTSITYETPTTILVDNELPVGGLTRLYVKPNYTLVGNPSISTMRLFLDYVYLDSYERKYFAQANHRYLIEQLQFSGSDGIAASQTSKKVKLDFNLPVKELFWIYQTDENVGHNQLLNFKSSPDEFYETAVDDVSELVIKYNGIDRFETRKGEYFRLIQPYQKHTRVPFDKYIYCYSFSCDPEIQQPMGASNYSKIDNVELMVSMRSGHQAGTFRTYALNYNILRVTQGMGGIAFSN